MPAPTLKASGTTTTDGTEQTLATITDAGTYQVFLDTAAMVAGDEIEVRVYYKVLAGGTERLLFLTWVIAHAQADPIKFTPAVGSDISIKITLKRTAGTDRAYPWKVLSY